MTNGIQYYINSYRDRIQVGDILDMQHIVVPIKTGGRIYGAISQQFMKRYPGFKIPVLDLCQAEMVVIDKEKQTTATFIAYWSDESEYTQNHMALAATRSLSVASRTAQKLQEDWDGEIEQWQLAMPMFRGAEESAANIAAIEAELQECYDVLCNCGIPPCEVDIVVRNAEFVPV